ncbi:putative secreted protein (Por secretion system target) [Lutibacter oceani]|uniref:Putative secreted protein (Por secretion system target) n=1 Tax=Lutibacter oceani TaxID=1853311 RepID=A0A3D9RUR6_9FLAO|nr:M14 family zinc carboxypeptidase [Lutibacter oceani]REE83587.1 putative secreted protein (Por secretion system target) [Lutibacter oceani]
MKFKLLIVLLLVGVFSNAQNNKELANKYLTKRGELVFTFTANNFQEIKQLSRIISFDHGQNRNNPLKIKAIANKKNFEKFLAFNLPFEVNIEANEPKNVVMFDPKIHKKGVSGKSNYTLSFPLTAYPTYAQYVAQMNEFVADHPNIARLVNIGTTPGSAAGTHDLLFLVLSDNVATNEAEPRLMYTSSIHGDELAGYPSMLNLIDHLITAYNDSGNSDYAKAQSLINGSEIWINPLANPDGTFRTTNADVNSSIRGNANGIDMNRNYPAPDGTLHPDGQPYQYETTQFMTLADTYHFVLAANFHGGEEVFNYPWDFTYDRPVDNDWWRYVGQEYALNAQNDSPLGYSDPNDPGLYDSGEYFDFLKSTIYESNPILGVTHGADWYQIDGGRQDYMNFEQQCREVTIELSQTKTSPSPASAINYDILDMWDYNKNAYIDYLLQGTYGFKGIVTDNSTSNPIKAKITVVGRDDQPLSRNSWVETELPHGDFYRLIEAGTYDVLIEADCYQPVTLLSKVITNGVVNDLGTISLIPMAVSAPTSLTETNITAVSATLNWEDLNVTSYDIQYRVNGIGGWILSSSSTNSLAISSLTANTTYEYQVRSICGGAISSYSNSKLFTTSMVSYCNSTGDTSTRGITNVTFIGETTINNSDTDNTSGYEDFSSTLSSDIDKSKISPTYSLSVTATSGATGNDPLFTNAFIDFNGDGDFDDSGEIINLGTIPKQSTAITSLSPVTINIPSNSIIGAVRMRISSKKDVYPTSCENFSAIVGEVEDYTINIIDSSLGVEDELLSTFNLYPNPSNIGEIKLTVPNEIQEFNIEISNLLGQKVFFTKKMNQSNEIHSIDTSDFKSGVYIIAITTNLGRATKKLIIQ